MSSNQDRASVTLIVEGDDFQQTGHPKRWELTDTETKKFYELLNAATILPPTPVYGDSGYRGLWVSFIDKTTSLTYAVHILDGVMQPKQYGYVRDDIYLQDKYRALEKWLLATGKEAITKSDPGSLCLPFDEWMRRGKIGCPFFTYEQLEKIVNIPPKPTSPQMSTHGRWITFTHHNPHFSFSYPERYTTVPGCQIGITKDTVKLPSGMYIHFTPAQPGKSLEDHIGFSKSFESGTFTLDNKRIIERISSSPSGHTTVFHNFLLANNYFFTIIYTDRDSEKCDPGIASITVFEKILESFKFD